MTTQKLQALILELGGPPRLLHLLERFYERMSQDVMIGFFFDGKDLQQIASKQQEFILKAAGLSPRYSGKNPATAHLTLPPILDGHFDRRIQLLKELLAEEKVSSVSIATWIEFESAFRNVVVATPRP